MDLDNCYYKAGSFTFDGLDPLTGIYPYQSGPPLCFARPDKADELLARLNAHAPGFVPPPDLDAVRIPVTGPTTPDTAAHVRFAKTTLALLEEDDQWSPDTVDAIAQAAFTLGLAKEHGRRGFVRSDYDQSLDDDLTQPLDKPDTGLPINTQNIPKDHPAFVAPFTLSAEPETKSEMIRRVAAESGIHIDEEGRASFIEDLPVAERVRAKMLAAASAPTDVALSPDPDNQNEERSIWAKAAVDAFIREAPTDEEDVIADLIADLGHLCDRHPQFGSMPDAIRRGNAHYLEETDGEGRAFADKGGRPTLYVIDVHISCMMGDGDRPDSHETHYFSSYDTERWAGPVVAEMLPRLSPALPFNWNRGLQLGDNEDEEYNLHVSISELVPANFPLL